MPRPPRPNPYRPHPEPALRSILNARDYEQALHRLTVLLARAWEHGLHAGWDAGVSDAIDDEPRPPRPNPYQ